MGELRFAQRAGIPAERLVVHGNNKSDEELRAAAEARTGYVVLDSVEELGRARNAGVERMLARVTPGIDATTHESIRTGHVGSKFGMAPEEALALRDDVVGLHVHVGSQLLSTHDALDTVAWLNRFLADSGWTPEVLDLGGGLGVPTRPGETAPSIAEFVAALRGNLGVDASLIFEPGRSLVGHAGVTLYRVGSVKRSGERNWVAIDGGISDNPRPQLYDAQYTEEEYHSKRGWGHSTWLEATRVARDAGVKQLVLFHHDPLHDDETMQGIVNRARRHFESTDAAREGTSITI